MNMLTHVFVDRGHDLLIRSNRRRNFPVHPAVAWHDFSSVRPYPQRIDRHPLRYAIAATYPFDWLRALSWVRDTRADAVLLTVSMRLRKIDIMAHRALRRAGVETVVIAHKPHPGYFERHDTRTADGFRPFYEAASRIVVLTEYARDLFMSYFGLPVEKFVIAPLPHFGEFMGDYTADPVLLESLRAWAGKTPVLSLLSNANMEHGFGNMLEALPHLRRISPDSRLLCVQSNMSSRQAEDLRARFAAAGFDPAALYIHAGPYSHEELAAFLAASWCVLTPYAWATQSSVIALAAGAGLPVVATDVGGLSEMVLPGESGEMVPVGDATAMAEACARVLDPARNDAYREGARRACAGILSPDATSRIIVKTLQALGV